METVVAGGLSNSEKHLRKNQGRVACSALCSLACRCLACPHA